MFPLQFWKIFKLPEGSPHAESLKSESFENLTCDHYKYFQKASASATGAFSKHMEKYLSSLLKEYFFFPSLFD